MAEGKAREERTSLSLLICLLAFFPLPGSEIPETNQSMC
jgi:hypothetical protein